MKLPKYVSDLINLIEKENYQVYVVGGAIRDYLLKKENLDYDLTTNMPYDEIVSLCKKYNLKINTQGQKHETVGITYKHNYVEVTCFRGLNKDKLSQDLKLRDFTINSLAYINFEIIDVTSGINDLKNNLLRSYKPKTSFSDDPLRILRMYRFVAKYGFNIDSDTYSFALKEKNKLDNIAVERIYDELNKIIISNPLVFTSLAKDGILDVLFNKYKLNINIDTFSSNMNLYFNSSIIKKKNIVVNYYLFLLVLSSSTTISLDELTSYLLKKYKFSSELSKRIKKQVNLYLDKLSLKPIDDLFYIINSLKFDKTDLDNLFIINSVLKNNKGIDNIKKVYLNKIKNKEVIFLNDINISGDKIISLTNFKGKEIGDIKFLLYKECFYLKLDNNIDTLVKRIKTI